ncbi:hypothetical protein BDV96DRAFT_140572 [Lophiotrema nucula]|uniref:C2H2-type domain-containing protein n=1 Tax=Lophiotrema nucula TaxID=690887 RepID=A0A6A5ZRB3_9PLEO|nr:hypothetical protein BDV96DRAFT_140572 [Lophiotrema nucula]
MFPGVGHGPVRLNTTPIGDTSSGYAQKADERLSAHWSVQDFDSSSASEPPASIFSSAEESVSTASSYSKSVLSTSRKRHRPASRQSTCAENVKYTDGSGLGRSHTNDSDCSIGKSIQKKKRFKLPKVTDEPMRRLKCPYYQKIPEQHNRHSCRGDGFANMAKLKDHLKRVHTRPLRCTRCWENMSSSQALDAHLQADRICTKLPEPKDDRICQRTLRDLNFNRSPFSGADTVSEKWQMLYYILFPDEDEVPSPYEEVGASMQMDRELERTIEEETMKLLGPLVGPAVELVRGTLSGMIKKCRTKRAQSTTSIKIEHTTPKPQPSNPEGGRPLRVNACAPSTHECVSVPLVCESNITESQPNMSACVPGLLQEDPDNNLFFDFDWLTNGTDTQIPIWPYDPGQGDTLDIGTLIGDT